MVISQKKICSSHSRRNKDGNAKLVDTPMDPSVKLVPDKEELYFNLGRYKQLVNNLNYLTDTHFDITFVVNIVSQFLNSLCEGYCDVVVRILK